MKKVSRDERKGAIALAIVIILVIAGLFAFRKCSQSRPSEPSDIKIIYAPSDSAGTPAEHSSEKTRKSKRKKSTGSRKSSGGSRGVKSKKEQAREPRDFLADTIPVLQP